MASGTFVCRIHPCASKTAEKPRSAFQWTGFTYMVVSATLAYQEPVSAIEILQSRQCSLAGSDVSQVLVSSGLDCWSELVAGERLHRESRDLNGLNRRVWWYRLLWWIVMVLLPVRSSSVNFSCSMDRISACGGTGCSDGSRTRCCW